ncbi:PTS sugar transporter subunit IIB [Klebsiella sp. WP7-S18-CRE-02]|uniref:PTS sugar transporter subunit IIB n=1 Tax=unclassified Klebsiella TaxID=2608929 RepID=UPI0015DBE0B5|nr:MULTISPECIES: PTS sugar transporter subunit IIB [unclassified Klebsiella]HAT3953418.1 PTS sugar transporter subunit IIB [Kluyvera ascorbata]BBR58074.1 PTS sugar transporter subunit IIB [Klebsiella sp. WP4-W18-ESBL-05]BBS92675.1 PTS sugar transporter subunit IIB [Klebsiella sp. WP7-S18-CRE-02]BBS97704.1 PTS sugar transporter subunit IIB [Klebsiella sp. WP7-S18-CRE-03]BBT02771.1 PTS sugar transporter subunit IIB [Klebsiella sp. WP7-S18-ESBL-04]
MNYQNLSILLVCNLGASTSVMVSKMREVVDNSEVLKGQNIRIDARSAGDLNTYIADYDLVMVGPQMKHKFPELAAIAGKYAKPIEVIDSQAYGLADGALILKQALYLYHLNRPAKEGVK